jgi:hypothetical protein
MSSGTVFPLRPSAPLTDVIGSSPLLGTPTGHPRTHSRPVDHGTQLANDLLKLLPTPMARTNGGTEVSGKSREGGRMLEESVKLLPTPAANPPGWRNLEVVDRDGNPPTHGNQRWYDKETRRIVQKDILHVVKLLPTPRANDGSREAPRRSGPGHGPMLEQLAGLLSTGETTNPRSGVGSPPSDLRLSPWFVEWMMGAPEGWSDPDCPLSATAFASRSATSQGATSSSASGSE